MLKDLVKVANRLDSLGLSKEADVVDRLITKLASSSYNDDEDLEEMGFQISEEYPRNTEGEIGFDIENASCKELSARAMSLKNLIQIEIEEYKEKQHAFRTGAWIQEKDRRFATPQGRSDYLNDIIEIIVTSKEELELVEEAMQKCL